MITLTARALAKVGIGTLLVDLLGTGDSDGEYVDARWAIWMQNLIAARSWLEAQATRCRGLWGIRLGAILAAEVHRVVGDPRIPVVVWQPVIDGKIHLTQFLRMRVAAQMDRPHLPKETTTSMRATLASGKSIEVGGYEIHPELAAAIDVANLRDSILAPSTQVLWVEQATDDSGAPAPGTAAAVEAWRASGISVTTSTFAGPAFWQIPERVIAPELIASTVSWLDGVLAS